MDRSQYQGKPFILMLLALCVPAIFLYLRLVLTTVSSQAHVSSRLLQAMNVASFVFLLLFFGSQIAAAIQLQKMLKPRTAPVAFAFQFLAVLGMGVLFSVVGAVMLESFGIEFMLRAGLLH